MPNWVFAGCSMVFLPISYYSGACVCVHTEIMTLQSSASLRCSRSAASCAKRCFSWHTTAQTRTASQQQKQNALMPHQFNPCTLHCSPLQGCARSGGPLLALHALPPDKPPLPASYIGASQCTFNTGTVWNSVYTVNSSSACLRCFLSSSSCARRCCSSSSDSNVEYTMKTFSLRTAKSYGKKHESSHSP